MSEVVGAVFTDKKMVSMCTARVAAVMKLQPVCSSVSIDGGPYLHVAASKRLLCVVVEGDTAPFMPSFVVLYDGATGAFSKHVEFSSDILALRVTEDLLFVSLVESVQIVSLESLRTIASIERRSNTGLISVSTSRLAFDDESQPGYVSIVAIPSFSIERKIKCHKDKVRCLSVSSNGELLTTASNKGTLIRVFHIVSGDKISEFRRGFRSTDVVAVDTESSLTCAISETSVHVFPAAVAHMTVPMKVPPVAMSIINGSPNVVTSDGLLSVYGIDAFAGTTEVLTQHRFISVSVQTTSHISAPT